MKYESVPDLTAQMRSHCPMGMGNDCACAARIEGRLDTGESEGAILAEYSHEPMDGVLIIDIMMGLMAPPASPEEVAGKVNHLRDLMKSDDDSEGALMAVALISSDIISDLTRMDHNQMQQVVALVNHHGGPKRRDQRPFDIDAFLADAASGGGNPDVTIEDDMVPTGSTMRRAAEQIDETVLV